MTSGGVIEAGGIRLTSSRLLDDGHVCRFDIGLLGEAALREDDKVGRDEHAAGQSLKVSGTGDEQPHTAAIGVLRTSPIATAASATIQGTTMSGVPGLSKTKIPIATLIQRNTTAVIAAPGAADV